MKTDFVEKVISHYDTWPYRESFQPKHLEISSEKV